MGATSHEIAVGRACALALAWVVAAIGCAAVGPDYESPVNQAPAAWQADLAGGEVIDAQSPQDLASWWIAMNDPILAGLERQAVSGNFDLKIAVARVREARARRGVSGAALFPTLDMSADATRSGSGENSGVGRVSESYSAGFDAAWELDLFGGLRRSREAADADLQAAAAGLYDVMVSLTAEVGLGYIEVRTYQTRLCVAEANLSSQQETYELIQDRYTVGLSNELALQQARYNLESTRSRIPGLRTGLAAAMNRLAVLTGQPPGRLAGLSEPGAIPVIPASMAVGIPADVLRRRPDIRQAERELAAQTARVGAAVADLYPALRLGGAIGFESSGTANLVQWASRMWSFGPRFSWKVFDAGAVRNAVKIQEALQEQALAAYQSTVLASLQEVENGLVAYAQEQLRRERLVDAVESARQAEKLSKAQFMAGVIDFSNVLEAQRTLLSFQDQLAESEGTVAANLIRLYKALGGGWSPSVLEEVHFEKDDAP